jgi:MFS family permease
MQYLVYAVAFLSSLAQSLVAPAILILAIERFGAQNFHLGLLAAGGSGLYTVMALASGRVSERLPIRTQLAVSSFILGTSYFMMFFAPSYLVLLLLNILNGITTGLLWAPLEGVLSRLSNPALMRRNVGRYNLSWSLGMAVGYCLYSYWARIAFQAGAAMIFATGAMLLLLRAPGAGWGVGSGQRNHNDGNDDPHHRFFLLIAWSGLFAAYIGVAAVRQLFPKLTTELNISPETMGRIYGVGVGVQTLAMAAMGRFHGWHYRKEAFYIGEIGMAAGAILVAVGRGPLVLAAGHIVLGGAMAILYSCSLYYSMQYSARAHHNTSVHEGVIGTAATTPVLLGYIADRFHFTPISYYIAAVVALVFLSVHVILFSRGKRDLSKKSTPEEEWARSRE